MRTILTLERSFSQLLTPSAPLNACRSCRSRAGQSSQRRQLQTSAAQRAGFGLRERIFGKKEETDVATTGAGAEAEVEVAPERRTPDFPGWYLPQERELPEGWAKTPQEDTGYMVANEGKELEHIGGEEWLDKQFDAQGEYKGWSRVKRANNMSSKDLERCVMVAAKEAGLGEQSQKLDSKVKDIATKFKIVKSLRASTKIQIPDIVMNRAETLRDFHKAVLSKPKPKKLSFELLGNEELLKNGNLQVRGRRQTPIHKDRAVGRWKLIELELTNKGLPITGHGAKAQRGFDSETKEATQT